MAEYELIPGGKYLAIPEDAAFGESNTGSPRVECKFRIKGGDHDGRLVFADLYMTDAAADRTIESLRYCGCRFPDADVTNLKGFGDKEVQVVVEIETYNGKQYNKVKWVNAANGGGRVKPNNPLEDKEALANRMRGRVAKAIGGQVPPPEIDDGDIPF